MTSYQWDFGDGSLVTLKGLANSTQNTHIYTKAGKYNVTVTASNTGGQASCYITLHIEGKGDPSTKYGLFFNYRYQNCYKIKVAWDICHY